MKLKNKRYLLGFTLIEMLIVAGIIAVLGTVSLVSLVGFRNSQQMEAISRQIAATLREAESRSLAQDKSSIWGVEFNNPTGGDPFYSLFYINSLGATTEEARHPLPQGMIFDSDLGVNASPQNLQVGEVLQVIFDQISGKPKTWRALLSQQQTQAKVFSYVNNSTNQLSFDIATSNRKSTSKIEIKPSGIVNFQGKVCATSGGCSTFNYIIYPPVRVTLGLNATSTPIGQPVGISWTSLNANTCNANWTTSHATSGMTNITPTPSSTFAMTCDGPGGSDTDQVFFGGGGAGHQFYYIEQ